MKRLLIAISLLAFIGCCKPCPDPIPTDLEVPRLVRPHLPIEDIKPGSTKDEYIDALFKSLALEITYSKNLEEVNRALARKKSDANK